MKPGLAYRQESIIDYMFKFKDEGNTTRQVADSLGLTTSAVLAAFKRLRTKGRVYNLNDRWYLSTLEKSLRR